MQIYVMSLPAIALVFTILCAIPAFANPVISEFMADNETTVSDEDGEFSDWIEIHNPTTSPVSLDDWCLTDKATELTKWRFPDVVLEPGGFLVVWASGKDRRVVGEPLHTNFSLAKDGEFLAVVRPDGTTVEHAFAPSFPSQEPDTSYGARFQSTTLLAEGAVGRYMIPTGAGTPGPTWNQQAFNDSGWASGPSGFGFGIAVPGITVRQVSKNGSISGLVDALNLIALPESDPLVLHSNTAVYDTLNLLGDGSDGHYGFNDVPPGGGGDHYVIVGTGYVFIPTEGDYTFGLNSDDGGRILIDGVEIMRDDSGHGPKDTLGSIHLSAGPHSFEAVMFEMGGGDEVEFFAAPGVRGGFDAAVFRLVGDVANGGLSATTGTAGAGAEVATDLGAAMSGRSDAFIRMPFTFPGAGGATALSLVMRYNDGFAAWLDGTAVASANAPAVPAWNSTATASRSSEESLRRQGFNLPSGLAGLTIGTNVLAIQGLASSTADTDFLVLPELIMGNLDPVASPAFYGGGLATPGWINGQPSSLGNVADTQFSIKRGFHTSPISVAITSETPGAVIRYTTDGSTPTATHGSVYAAPLTVSSTTVLRAIATLDGWKATDVDTQTYLFPDDIITQSSNGAAPPGWPAGSGTSQVLDFGMDPEIVNHANPAIGGAATVKSALLALPTISLTTDLSNLFDINGSQGIYAHPGERGYAWERPASMEWINPPDAEHPNGTSEFQVNAGVRLRGGYSRSADNPKHAFRLFFREEYGDTKLRYPLFGEDGAQDFDKIDLRTSQNYSWSWWGDPSNTFLREESTRQAQLDMGQPGSHVRYVHLYLNGQYWGLFNLDERPEAAFSESYLGGDKDDYDVIKAEVDSGYTVGATDGDLVAWQDLWNKGKTHRASPTNANYFRMMGLAADGATPTADPVLLDADNLIDYMLLTFWSGNTDGCVSAFLGNERANNWFGSRMRDNNPGAGFRFYVHDFEHALFNVNEDRTGPFNSGNESNFAYSNPMFLHQDLIGNAEYRMRWADRIHRHLFNDGALTPNAWQARINQLAAVVDASIAAESARWGDFRATPPRNRLDWINARNSLLAYPSPRNPVVLNQMRADNLYPALDAPVLTPYGGYQPSGVEIVIQGPAGASLYYMPDGSDPRAVGGALRAGAISYSAGNPLILSGVGENVLRVRALSGGVWSAMSESTYQVGTAVPAPADLVVSEILADPQDPNEEAEFIELLNVSASTLDLAGARFTNGIDFTFPAGSVLAPGERVLIVREVEDFEELFGPGLPVAGEFANGTALANNGERIVLEAADGTTLLDFTYGVAFPWPDPASGRSTVLTDPADPSNPLCWRPSTAANGNPGSSDSFDRAPGQSLLDYALAEPVPSFDQNTGMVSVIHRLGADAARLSPEWSVDLDEWHGDGFSLWSETPDSSGNSELRWKLDPLPPGQAFVRLRVSETP